ncbi:MAG: outer membrane protein assembly factor BamD [Deltaproteobacteria bacterium]|nr:outer membrane protein assembly factor BamD [Deltaproteobacteria bacterium]
MKLHKNLMYVLIALLAVSQSACLKTRSQIKGQGAEADQSDDSDSGGKPVGRGSRAELEEIKNEVTRISGKVEELDHNQRGQNFAQTATELKDYTTRLDARVGELEKNQLLVLAELKAIKDKHAAAETSAREAAVPAGDAITQGLQLVAEKKCDEAEEKFRSLGKRSLKGKDAAEVHYGMGEALYCKKDYKNAILEYSEVQKSSSKSARIPASLYRIGLAFAHLNMNKEARGFFSELVERYPKTPEAKKARARVKE